MNEAYLKDLIRQLRGHYDTCRYHLIASTIAVIINALRHGVACERKDFNDFCRVFKEFCSNFSTCLSILGASQPQSDQISLLFKDFKEVIEKIKAVKGISAAPAEKP
jgi:hypothetical protein